MKFANITSRNFKLHTSSYILPRLTACLVVNATPTETFLTVLDILTETVRQIWGDEKLSIFDSCQKQCYRNLQVCENEIYKWIVRLIHKIFVGCTGIENRNWTIPPKHFTSVRTSGLLLISNPGCVFLAVQA